MAHCSVHFSRYYEAISCTNLILCKYTQYENYPVRYASFLSFAAFNKNKLLSAHATTIALLLFRYVDESVT
jgi:hypothetical protein